jgi:hypothetical protein
MGGDRPLRTGVEIYAVGVAHEQRTVGIVEDPVGYAAAQQARRPPVASR